MELIFPEVTRMFVLRGVEVIVHDETVVRRLRAGIKHLANAGMIPEKSSKS